jgi:hypothetical protein
MKQEVKKFQKVIWEELMEKTFHPERYVEECLDQEYRKKLCATFDMSKENGWQHWFD